MRLRVAMLGWEFPPFVSGGLGVHCYELTRVLAGMGIEVDFFMPKTSTPLISSTPNLRIIPVALEAVTSTGAHYGPYGIVSLQSTTLEAGATLERAYGPGFFGSVRAYNDACIQKVMQENMLRHYDLIHAHDWITSIAAVQLRHLTGIPLVGTVHSTELDRTAGLGANPWIMDLETNFVRCADAVISVSRMSRNRLVHQFRATPDNVFVVYNGVNPGKFANAAPVVKRNGEKIVLFHGRLSIQKGPDFFLKAAARVLQIMPNVRFIVSGTGDMLQQLVKEATELGILSKVTFTGYSPEDYLPNLYASADVYVLPSVSEPFGITALEAMSAGTPTVVSHSTGVKESLQFAMSADFWDTDEFANKILAILSYAPLKNVLKDGSKKEVRLFSWSDTAQQTLAVYHYAQSHRRS